MLLFSVTTLFAQEKLPNYSYFDNDLRFVQNDMGDPIVTLTHFGFFPLTEKFGFTDYASIEGNDQYQYGQVLLGGYYNITDELSVYVMGGRESVSNDMRFGYMVYFTNGDQIRTYAFYQRNQSPFDSDTKLSEWYDIMFRYGVISKEKESYYLGGRYMKWYGLGPTLSYRRNIGDGDNVYLGYTTYFDVNNDLGVDVLPTVTLAFEFF